MRPLIFSQGNPGNCDNYIMRGPPLLGPYAVTDT